MLKTMKAKIDALLRDKPGLKAREIASALAFERSEVNAFLHANKDRYQQDSEFRWRVATSSLGISLPSKWTSADDFERALLSCGDALDGPEQDVTIYLPSGCNPMIDCTARLLSLANQLAHRGKSATLDFSQSQSAHSYLDRAGFFGQLDSRVEVRPDRPTRSAALRFAGKSETLVEFGAVEPWSPNKALIDQLTAKFVQQSSKDYEVAAFTIFGELIGNVAEHSKSELVGFAGLQKYTGRRSHIQTVISDSGLGIASTLRPALRSHYPPLHKKFGVASLESDIGLVKEALQKGYISRSGKGHGLGFYSSKEHAFKCRASFSVRQENFSIRFNYRKGELALVGAAPQTDVGRLLGTHICFDFYVD